MAPREAFRSPRRRPPSTGRRASRRPARLRSPRRTARGPPSPPGSTCRSRSGRDGGWAARRSSGAPLSPPASLSASPTIWRVVFPRTIESSRPEPGSATISGEWAELHPQAVASELLSRLDEGPRDVAVLDQAVVLGEPAGARETVRRGIAAVRERLPGRHPPAPRATISPILPAHVLEHPALQPGCPGGRSRCARTRSEASAPEGTTCPTRARHSVSEIARPGDLADRAGRR